MRRPVDLQRWGGVLVAVAAIAVLWPTVADVFIYDDAPVVRDNALLAAGHLKAFFGGNVFGTSNGDLLFRPLLLVSLWIDRALLGNRAWPMHAVNVLLHAFTAALFFSLLRRLVADTRRAFAAALLFAVHPIHLDAVAFIINRSEIFALSMLLLAARFLMAEVGRWRYVAAALAVLAALLCKETAAGGIAALALAVVLSPELRRRRALAWGLFAAVIAFIAYALARQSALGSFASNAGDAWIGDRRPGILVPTVARVFVSYLRLIVWPWIRIDYSDYQISTSFADPRAIASYALHAAILVVAVLLVRRGRRAAAFCILGFYAALLPVSHLFPFREILAERFLYIPSAFACAALVFLPARRPVFLVIGLYALVCLAQATYFHSPVELWSRVIERAPTSARAHYNLGTTWFEMNRCDIALPLFENAVKLEPAHAHAWTNLGECRVALGDNAGARPALETAARLDITNPRAFRNLAVWRALNGDPNGAREALERARQLSPNAPENSAVQRLIDR